MIATSEAGYVFHATIPRVRFTTEQQEKNLFFALASKGQNKLERAKTGKIFVATKESLEPINEFALKTVGYEINIKESKNMKIKIHSAATGTFG